MSYAAEAPFTLQAPPGTDIWRKPPSTNVWNAPISQTRTIPLSTFQSARVTFWADWKEEYDQAGLLLVPRPSSSTSSSSPPKHWIKSGLEFYKGKPHLSTVGCERWADWSIGLLDMDTVLKNGGKNLLTIEARRERDVMGDSIWVYQVLNAGEGGDKEERIPLREICWVFGLEGLEDEGEWVLDVSPLVARPDPEGKGKEGKVGSLEVGFEEFVVVAK